MATQNIYALTDTWNAGGTTFTGIGLNVTDTASAAGSMLIDLQVGGASQFKVTKAGAATITTIELGHASDTTLSRVSAGVVAIEGVEVTTNTATQSLSNKTLSSPTLSGTVSGASTFSGLTDFSAGTRVISGGRMIWLRQDAGLNRIDSYDNPITATVPIQINALTYDFACADVVRATISATATTFTTPVTALSTTAIPAGGGTGTGLKVSSTANFGVFFGSGAPTLSAAKGSLYMRSDGSGVNDRMYVNTDGATTWTAVVTVA